MLNEYLLLTELEGHTENNGPSFLLIDFSGPGAKHAGHKSNGKNEELWQLKLKLKLKDP